MAETGGISEAVAVEDKQLVPNFASFYGESIMPPSDEGKKLTPDEFQAQFPVRYDVWNTLSQSMLGHSDTGISLNNAEHIQTIKTRLHVLNQLDRYIAAHHSGENGRTLRKDQMTTFEKIRDHLEQGETQGYIKLPTGSGKTVIFTEIAEATDLKTLIVVPKQLLVDQTADRFKKFAPNMNVGKVYAEAKERGKQVEITTYDSLLASIKNGLMDPKEYDLVVLDEAHKGLSAARKDAIGQFSNAIKLGFTATPNYSEEKGVTNLLGKEIHSMTVREAVEEGMLSPFSVYLVKTQTDISNVKITSGGDFDPRELERAINNKARNLAAVQVYEELMKDKSNQKLLTIAYCAGIDHAKSMVDEFQQKGITAAAVYRNQPKAERKRIMKDYKKGKIQVLCNAQLLIEGFDEEKVGIILNAAPTTSVVNAEQRGGRALRLDENNPNKHAIIVDILDQNSNRNFPPVTYAQIVDGAYVYPSTSSSSQSSERSEEGYQAPDINIEGIEVITNPEEVMRIVHEMQEITVYSPPPEGWLIMGDLKIPNTLASLIGKGSGWIRARLPHILAEIKRTQDEQEIPEQDRELLMKDYLSDIGRPLTHYAPLIVERLQELAKKTEKAPEGWMAIGEPRFPGTIASRVGRGSGWIKKRLPHVLAEIKRVQDEQEIPEEDRELLFDTFFSPTSGHDGTFYTPLVAERLQELAKTTEKAPEKWLAIGETRFPGTLASSVGKGSEWIKARLPQVFAAIKREQDQQNISEEDREVLLGEYVGSNGKTTTFYSPILLEYLKKLADK